MSQEKSQFDFNDRYGIKPAQAWIKYAAFFAIIGGAWLLWKYIPRYSPKPTKR